MPTGTIPVWVQMATAVGAILSPLVAYIVAGRNVSGALKSAERQTKSAQEIAAKQIRSSIVSANRQKWLDAVRDDVAGFVAEFDLARATLPTSRLPGERAEKTKNLRMLYTRVSLRLNPDRPEQKAIIDCLDRLVTDVVASDTDQQLIALTKATQQLARSVWRQVKSGD